MGVYSGFGVIDDGNGMIYSFDFIVVGVGVYIIIYMYMEVNGCLVLVLDEVEVKEVMFVIMFIDDINDVNVNGVVLNFGEEVVL